MIFEFSAYRSYLRAYLKKLPKKGHGEARKIAIHLRVSSTFISNVLAGSKDLTLEQAEVLSEYLGHSEMEADYFLNLIQLERAGTHRLKKYFDAKLKETKDKSLQLSKRVQAKNTLTDEEKSTFYSHPLYSAIHLYTATHAKGRSIEEISRRFDIPRSRASKMVQFLDQAQLIQEVEKNGRYVIGTQSTHLEVHSPHLHKHHTNWRLKAIQSSENLSDQELIYTVNVALSESDFSKLRESMVQFIKGFLDTVHPSPSEELACFNLDFFWIRK